MFTKNELNFVVMMMRMMMLVLLLIMMMNIVIMIAEDGSGRIINDHILW